MTPGVLLQAESVQGMKPELFDVRFLCTNKFDLFYENKRVAGGILKNIHHI